MTTRRFMIRPAFHMVIAAVLAANPGFLPGAVLGAEPSAGGSSASGSSKRGQIIELEQPDDPPGFYDPRANSLARSPSPTLVVGSYQSIQVNVDGSGNNIVGDAANEPSIAVNPMNPMNMVIGWRQFNTVTSNFRQAGWAYTSNGGQTWTFPGVLTPGVFRSDPVLDADSQGNFYYQSLKQNFTADVFKSTNGGASWQAPVTEFGGDKNWMAIDRSGGIGNGNIYGIWQRFSACCGSNVLTRSTNGGTSFETPVPVTNSPTFGILAVGPNGELYATGIDGSVTQDFNHFVVAKSTNAANPAATPTFTGGRVDLGGVMELGGTPNPQGLLGQANVAVDSSPGPTRGNVYVAASVGAGDPVDVNLVRSTDGGATWSAPVRVNDDPSQTNNWQWMAAHSVAHNGRIDVIWNDSRSSGQSNLVQLYYAYSWDGGATWSPNVAVSPVFNSLVGFPNQNKIGDYSTIVSNDTGADVAYAATFNNEEDIWYVRVFPDCNSNGISDVTDLANATSQDCNGNHVPDECETPVCGPSLIYAASTPQDSCAAGGAGSGNGSVDPGEDALLAVSLRNDGTVNLTGVSASLSTSTPGVTVTRAAATYPDIPTHGVASSNAPHFAYTVGTGVPCGTNVNFTLAATAAQGSWTRAFTVRVGAPATSTSTFNSTDVPKTIADLSTVTSNLTVPAAGAVVDVDAGVSLTHTFDGDLVLTLIGPSGTRILLANGAGGSGHNYTGTTFDDEATTPIDSGSAPFTGRFKPQQPLSGFDGTASNGVWKLEIQDVGGGDTGTLTAWSLTPTIANGFACSGCSLSPPALSPVMMKWSPGSKSRLQWESITGATFYNVYRGASSDLPNLLNPSPDSCRRATTIATATDNVIGESPPVGSIVWYLVRAANSAGEGPPGNATAGPRSQQSSGACP